MRTSTGKPLAVGGDLNGKWTFVFEILGDKLSAVFERLSGRGALSGKEVDAAMREIRIALLEADVALEVVKAFIETIRTEAIGEKIIRSIKPDQQIIKIVHDGLVDMLGGKAAQDTRDLNLAVQPPAVILLAGLQGSGKTTSCAKLAQHLRVHQKKKILLASLDTRRPAAMAQLALLSEQAGVDSLPIIEGQKVEKIARRALSEARKGGYDVVCLDTAGRTTIDNDLMAELAAVVKLSRPSETLLVADSLTGQDAVETARRFHQYIELSGLVLTRMDGDGRGGAALSMRAVTGLPIKFLGTGEKLDGLEVFDPNRVADRILGQGDIVALVEKASQVVDAQEAERVARKMQKGTFDLDDLAQQLGQMQKLGGLGGLMSLLPGMGKMKKQMKAAGGLDDELLKRQQAIIFSMTRQERQKPLMIKASRKKRIATGSGMRVQDVNKLLKMHRQMSDMIKKTNKDGGLASLMGGFDGEFSEDMSVPAGLTMDSLKALQQPGGAKLPFTGNTALPGLGKTSGGLPGLGGSKFKK